VLVARKDHDQATYHGLLAHAIVVVSLIPYRPRYDALPLLDALLVLALNYGFGVELNHFLEADD
jgi:hypothetical protein